MRRHELSDAQYARLESLLPYPRHHGKAGRPWLPNRTVVNGVLWILRTGAPWRDLPRATADGLPSSHASIADDATAPGPASFGPCWTNLTTKGISTMTCGASTAPSSVPLAAPAASDDATVAARDWT